MFSRLVRICALLCAAFLLIGWHPARLRMPPPPAPLPSENVNMYLYDTLLFVSNQSSGILVYSMRDSLHPRLLLTIPVQGNRGMAFKDSILYADSRGSLLALHLFQDSLFKVAKVIERGYDGWEGNDVMGYDDMVSHGCACGMTADPAVSRGEVSAPTGTGGSYAVFAVIDSFLYYLDNGALVALSIADPANPVEKSRTSLSWNVETLFPTDRYLFLGAQTGTHIYSRGVPEHPVFVSTFQHVRSCDPVVVRDTLAFVTLRSGGFCGAAQDELLSLSVANPSSQRLLDSYPIPTPWGLAVRDTLLYVSNGASGYTLVNAARPDSLFSVRTWAAPKTRDFIWDRDRLYIMGEDHLSLYHVADPENPALIVKIQ